jgi:hypothetical protein
MNHSAWTSLLIVVLVPLTLRWLATGDTRATTPGLLTYGTRAKTFALVMCTAVCLLLVLVGLASPPRGRDLPALVFLVLLFSSLLVPLVLEFFRVRYAFDERGIHVDSPWSRKRTLVWADIESARWRPIAKWLDLRGGGKVVHLSPMLVGLDAFARECVARVPAEALLDAEVKAVLDLMNMGKAGALVLANENPSSLQRRLGGTPDAR